MDRRNKKQMQDLKQEWIESGRFVLRDDDHPKDHTEIHNWLLEFLDKEERSDEDEYIASCVYHSLNFDIPFPATKSVRCELLNIVRMKIKNPQWMRFPR
jgi:hypothetical protein